MAFVHVVLAYPKTEASKDAGAAHAEYNLLLQTVFVVATVEMIGDGSILRLIALNICIEKKHRNFTAGGAFDPFQPGLDFDVSLFDGDQCLCRH